MIFFYNYSLNLMKSRQILEFVSYQFIAITVGVLNQCSIVDCDAVFFRTKLH